MCSVLFHLNKESALVIHLFYIYSGKFDYKTIQSEPTNKLGVNIPISGICHTVDTPENELSPSPLGLKGRGLSNV